MKKILLLFFVFLFSSSVFAALDRQSAASLSEKLSNCYCKAIEGTQTRCLPIIASAGNIDCRRLCRYKIRTAKRFWSTYAELAHACIGKFSETGSVWEDVWNEIP